MIQFSDWVITAQRTVIARQYDNLTRRLEVLGALPDGWTWDMLVQAEGHLDILSLSPCEGGIGIDLTAEMLALAGYYTMQLRGTQGELVRHTNQIITYIPESLSGGAQWPTLPSEFTQMEQRVQEMAGQAEQAAQAALESRQAIEDMTVSSETLGPGEQAAVTKTIQDGVVNLTFGIPAGAPGKDGADGAPGQNGAPGTDGGYYVPEVSEDGVLGWTPSLDTLPAVPPANIKGPPGTDGLDAPQINDSAISAANPWSSQKIIDALCPAFRAEGPVVACYPVEGYPLSVQAAFEPLQEGAGDPGQDNVRSISGWNQVQLRVAGKNLLDIAGGTKSGWNIQDIPCYLVPGQTYYYTNFDYAPGCALYGVSEDGSQTLLAGYWGPGQGARFTPAKRFVSLILGGQDNTLSAENHIQIEVGDAQTEYEPYRGYTYTAQLPKTVYGGTLDLASGDGTETWGYIPSYDGEDLPSDWISDRDVYGPGTTPTIGAQVAYRLAEPEPIQAEANPITGREGANTFWTDAQALTVSGRADLKQLVARFIQPENDAVTYSALAGAIREGVNRV